MKSYLLFFVCCALSCTTSCSNSPKTSSGEAEAQQNDSVNVLDEELDNGLNADNDMIVASEPGKSAIVTLEKGNVIYVGVRNSVDINLTGYTWDDGLKVSISQGSSIVDDTIHGKGHFWVQSIKPGNAEITIAQNGKKVSSKVLRIKSLPNPSVKVARMSGGKISKEKLYNEPGIRAQIDDFDFDVMFRVTKFSIVTCVKGFFQTETSESAQFTAKQKTLIEYAPSDGYIIITDIKVKGPDAKERDLQPVVFQLQ